MRVAKWGNSLGVRLPAAVVKALDLKDGDEIEIRVTERRRFEVARKPSIEERLVHLRRHRGIMPRDFQFDRFEANTRS